ncbi:DUF433 domain-containing protein [Planctomycetota bacterium]
MAPAIAQLNVPLRTDADGTIRVGNTRVTLDTLVAAFNNGHSAEEIVEKYPTLELVDVYCAIGYYLQKHDELDAYLREGEAQAEAIYKEIDARFPPGSIRARLLARQTASRGKR